MYSSDAPPGRNLGVAGHAYCSEQELVARIRRVGDQGQTQRPGARAKVKSQELEPKVRARLLGMRQGRSRSYHNHGQML